MNSSLQFSPSPSRPTGTQPRFFTTNNGRQQRLRDPLQLANESAEFSGGQNLFKSRLYSGGASPVNLSSISSTSTGMMGGGAIKAPAGAVGVSNILQQACASDRQAEGFVAPSSLCRSKSENVGASGVLDKRGLSSGSSGGLSSHATFMQYRPPFMRADELSRKLQDTTRRAVSTQLVTVVAGLPLTAAERLEPLGKRVRVASPGSREGAAYGEEDRTATGGFPSMSEDEDDDQMMSAEKTSLPYKVGRRANTTLGIVQKFKSNTANIPKGFAYLMMRPRGVRDPYNPYDLQAAFHTTIDPLHYFTVSAAGITRFDNGEAAFLDLKSWEREYHIFHQLIQLDVFKLYKKWKYFNVWHELMRKKTLILYRNYLNVNAFQLNPDLAPTLQWIRRTCLDFQKTHNLYLKAKETRTLEKFIVEVYDHLDAQKRDLAAMITSIRDNLEKACRKAMASAAAAREATLQVSLSVVDDFKGMSGKRSRGAAEKVGGAYRKTGGGNDDGGDMTGGSKKSSYVEQSQHRAVCRCLTNFVTLCDYIVINTLSALFMKTLRELKSDLHYPRAGRKPRISLSEMIQNTTCRRMSLLQMEQECKKIRREHEKRERELGFDGMIFDCDILFSKVDSFLHVNPTSLAFAEAIDDLVKNYIKTVNTVPRFVQMTTFAVYTEQAIEAGEDLPTGADVSEMIAAEEEYKTLTLSIRTSLAGSYAAVEKYMRDFEPFRVVYLQNISLDTEAIKESAEGLDLFRERIEQYKQQSEDIEAKIPSSQDVGLYGVHTDKLREFFVPSPLECLEKLHVMLPVLTHERNEALLKDVTTCNKILDDPCKTVEDYFEYMKYFNILANRMDTVNNEYDFVRDLFLLLQREKIHIDDEDEQTFMSATRPQYEKLRSHMQHIEDTKEVTQRDWGKNIDEQLDALKVRIAEVGESARDPLLEDEKADREKVMEFVKQLQQNAEGIEQREKELRRFQVAFSMEDTPIDTLEDMLLEVQLKVKLWTSVQSWYELTEEFKGMLFNELIPDDLQDQVNKYMTLCKQVTNKMPNNQMALTLKSDVDHWKNMSPVITALKNSKLDANPMQKLKLETTIGLITDAAGNQKSFYEIPSLSLQMLIDKGIFENIGDSIMAISRTATEEDKVEQALQKIQARWISGGAPILGAKPPMEFVLNNHKDIKDLYVLAAQSVEDIIAELEESSIHVSTISSNKYCTGFLREKVDRWEKCLKTIQDTLDKWLEFQRNWIYLENIFSSTEIRNQWKEDSMIFHGVDTQFRLRMRRVHDVPNVYMSIISDDAKSTPLLEVFDRDNKKLEQVLASLERKLEEKRGAFPRFYFLSNDDLLDILAKVKSPELVMPHMLKMFDGIKTLTFTSSNDITHICSMEGETVELQYKGIKAGRGQVEVWFSALEQEMFTTLRVLARNCLEDYEACDKNLVEWMFKHPVQLVLILSQMFWTRDVEAALDKEEESHKLMQKCQEGCYSTLVLLAELTGNKLSRVQRLLLSTLITLDVHSRDLVDEMVTDGVITSSEFGWTKLLRIYWEIDETDGQGNIFIRQNNSRFVYGYEYLGAQGRLVITPLTDRIYMTITGALKLYLGAAPAGPAGTGKTETTKDLAKNLARQCIVYNCSDGVTYKMMEKFFSGLIQTGAWCCLDEFNRINIEVLSVIASQVLEIKLALQEHKSTFTFQGTLNVRVRATYGCFITMNPGYAGRTELPDNLKILFRPVAVMTPDFRMIAEVILYSEGFKNAKELSLKITQLYKLSSEQLSPQDHYDFGMRALKSILVMAGDLKRSQPDVVEDLTLIVACNDSNIPKFVAEDIPLFRGIMQDLFPGATFPERDYPELLPAMHVDMAEKSLMQIDTWIKKGVQFYETLIVRHGVMLVGQTGTGKSESRNCIANALTAMAKMGSHNIMAKVVHQFVLNPKSVMMQELYGLLDPLTNGWRDGILAVIAKDCVRSSEGCPDHRWIVFDGPVDTLWIESLNSVLDDSKLLCLDSGERIKLPDTIHMLFEVADLAVASPATVSRCGMVYIDIDDLTWEALLGKWEKTKLTAAGAEPQCREYISSVIKKYVPGTLEFLSTRISIMISGGSGNMVQSCLDLFTFLIATFNIKIMPDPEGETVLPSDDKIFQERNAICNLLFVFSLIWGLGGNLSIIDMENFDNFVRDHMETLVAMPPHGLLYDYYPDLQLRRFLPWEKKVPVFKYNSHIPFFNMIVPTVDTVRYSFLVKILVQESKPVLLNGGTGVGKSILMSNTLSVNKESLGLQVIVFQFSAQTSSVRTQELIESKLKHKRKNILGAPPDRKVILFIDDLNMPTPEVFGASPCIELLRQLMGNGGFYDRKIAGFWKRVEDVTVVAACGPPEGGRNPVTMRLTRLFHLLQIPNLGEDSMKRIFVSILHGFFEEKQFRKDIKDMAKSMISGAVELFQRIKQEFRPRPSMPHYTYNLRDLAKICQGLMQVIPRMVISPKAATHLWIHECMRCLYDRLTNEEDRLLFTDDLVMTVLKRLFPGTHTPEEYFSSTHPIIWGDFLRLGATEPVYEECIDMKKIHRLFGDYLDEYNTAAMIAKEGAVRIQPMNLVFFTDHCRHLARIIRIIKQQRGNALLVGVGGSGKRSLSRLATHIAHYKIFEITVGKGYSTQDFHDSLLEMYKYAGILCKPMTFILSDNQIVYEGMLEDVNNILNSGEVPSLFPPDERDKMISQNVETALERGITHRDEIWNFFISRVRDNMHIVLCMSPVGDAFRTRCRQFPSLTNCCSCDWFDEWPSEALLGVAQRILVDVDFSSYDPALKDKLTSLCVDIHQCVQSTSLNFYAQLRRRYYITPTSYLEFLTLFSQLLDQKTKEEDDNLSRYLNGKQKMTETDGMIATMKRDIEEKQPLLEVASKETEQVVADLKVRSEAAGVVQREVSAQESEAAEQQKTASAIANKANARLEEAQPIMDAARAALDTIKPEHINELKTLNTGPRGAVLTCQAVMTFFDSKELPGWNGTNDWKGCREFLSLRGLIDKIRDYDVKHVKQQILTKIQKFIQDKDNFNADEVRKTGSVVCGPLCEWVIAVNRFAAIYKEVVPLEEEAAHANNLLAETNEKLRVAKQKLREVEDELNKLQDNYEKTLHRKELLETELNLSRFRLKNAVKLSESLKKEGGRWEENIGIIQEAMKTLPVTVFLSAACMAYYGAFTPAFREQLVREWLDRMREKGFENLDTFNFIDAMGDPMDTLTWQIASLPNDDTSTENAIITMSSFPPRRWPLLIDPQGQGLKWLCNMISKDNLKVVKSSERNYLRIIEMCIEQGKQVVLADVGETLDPALEPLLNRQITPVIGSKSSGGKTSGGGALAAGEECTITMSRPIAYNPDFRFYISTRLANPHYLPDVSTKVALVNFTVTMGGLENQMLGEVVGIEKKEVEEENNRTTKEISDGNKNLKKMEEDILFKLKNVKGNILDDEVLIETLERTQIDAAKIAERQVQAEKRIAEIKKVREIFRKVARRCSILFFVLADLALIDPMYQYSLDYFKKLVSGVVIAAEDSPQGYKDEAKKADPKIMAEHLLDLIEDITETTYKQICRGLFNKDKSILSLLISTSIARDEHDITGQEWQFFVRCTALVAKDIIAKPASLAWANNQQWELLDTITRTVAAFDGFKNDVAANSRAWEKFVKSSAPHEESLPKGSKEWDKILTGFQKILVIRVFREEKLDFALTNYIRNQMGSHFIEPPPFNIQAALNDSAISIPIVFILSQGSDPMDMLVDFSRENAKNLRYVSLGQGQGENAKNLIESCKKTGDWAMLQNCHLSKTFMPELEVQVAALQSVIPGGGVHENFRLWLTSTPVEFFPVSVLQNSIKLTNEAPTGLKANMIRCFNAILPEEYDVFAEEDKFSECSKERAYKKLIYGLCFFHSVILERKKFGPLGWNVRYEWNDTDFHVSKQWLKLFFEEQSEIPWEGLTYIIGQINYGGRVTDPQDRGTLVTILSIYLNKHLLEDSYTFSASGEYKAPHVDGKSIIDVLNYLGETMSLHDDPEVFGMHENANLRYQLQVSELIMSTVLSIQPRLIGHKGEGPTPEEQVMIKCKSFEEVLPDIIRKEEAGPHSFTVLPNGLPNSLSTVLSHELAKYNRLLEQIKNSLSDLQRALQGLSVLSEDLDKMYQSFLNDQVPGLWSQVAYASLKPLGSWFRDLVEKVKFIRGWVHHGEPKCFWITGFFNPAAFMTGVLQAFARAENVSVDKLGFSYLVVDTPREQVKGQPSRGCYIYGIFSDAWRWDEQKKAMADSLPGEPYATLPIMHFLPEPYHKMPDDFHSISMYRTTLRAGVISSLGASSNYILSIEARSDKGRDYWTLKGAACACALNN